MDPLIVVGAVRVRIEECDDLSAREKHGQNLTVSGQLLRHRRDETEQTHCLLLVVKVDCCVDTRTAYIH